MRAVRWRPRAWELAFPVAAPAFDQVPRSTAALALPVPGPVLALGLGQVRFPNPARPPPDERDSISSYQQERQGPANASRAPPSRSVATRFPGCNAGPQNWKNRTMTGQ